MENVIDNSAMINIEEAEQGTSLWQDAFIRLSKNKLACYGGAVLLF